MDSVELRRSVVVKVIMTDPFRQQVITEARDTIARLDRDLGIIDALPPPRAPAAEEQRAQIERVKAQLEWRIREIEGMENGAEMPFRSFDGAVSIRRGDNFLEKMGLAEIVLKDWEVVEIRGR